jgi:hypothetical protein
LKIREVNRKQPCLGGSPSFLFMENARKEFSPK